MSSNAVKNGIKKEIKKCLARRDSGSISSLDSESDWLISTAEDDNMDKVRY